MTELFNPFNRSVTGQAFEGQVPVQLRVEEGSASRAQVRAVQDAFAQFARRATFSRVPNPTERGVLGDGSAYRITSVGSTTIVQLWPEMPMQEGGKFKSGILVTLDRNYRQQVFLVPRGKFGKPTGVWDMIRVRNWVHPSMLQIEMQPQWAHTSWQSEVPERYLVGSGARVGLQEVEVSTPLDAVRQANGAYRFVHLYARWPFGTITAVRSSAVPDPLTGQYVKYRSNSSSQPVQLPWGDEVTLFKDSVRNMDALSVSRSRTGSKVSMVVQDYGVDQLLPYNGGTLIAKTQLEQRIKLSVKLVKVTDDWLEPAPMDNNTGLISLYKDAGLVHVEDIGFNPSTLSFSAPVRSYTAPKVTMDPHPLYEVGGYSSGGPYVRIWQTFYDCNYEQQVPEEEVISDFQVSCHGDTHYREWFDHVTPGVYQVWYQADNERVMIRSTAEEHYSVLSTGRRDMDSFNDLVTVSFSDVNTAQMTIHHSEREVLHLPDGRDFPVLELVVDEVCTATREITGPVTTNNTRRTVYEAGSDYSVKALQRKVYVVDPFLELMVYLECEVQYTRSVSASGNYCQYTSGADSWMANQPFRVQASGGGEVPAVPPLYLVIEFKGRIQRYPVQWPVNDQQDRRYMGAASVPIPITEPPIVLDGLASQMGMDPFVWSNRFDRAQYLLTQTLAGNQKIGHPTSLETGLIDSLPSQWQGVARGKVVEPLILTTSPAVTYRKDPLTGAAVLWVASPSNYETIIAPMMFLIDRNGIKPVQSLDPTFPVSRVTEVTEA